MILGDRYNWMILGERENERTTSSLSVAEVVLSACRAKGGGGRARRLRLVPTSLPPCFLLKLCFKTFTKHLLRRILLMGGKVAKREIGLRDLVCMFLSVLIRLLWRVCSEFLRG